MKTILSLSENEKQFWQILIDAKTTTWGNVEKMLASQLCRDLARLEQLLHANAGDDLLADIRKRTHLNAKMLRLKAAKTGDSAKHRIVHAILAAHG